ncbi:MAG: pyruvate, phosphate dikinase [Candidatus Omnitrophica bacterium]|nr:pyruvate, phosphate dikinase [Candidatus Omnitrophota bacterium]
MNTSSNIINRAKFEFGTKAETLERISGYLETVFSEEVLYFSVGEWRLNKDHIIKEIKTKFGFRKILVVRSSALGEDNQYESMAGVYKSRLNVDANDSQDIDAAVEEVIASYKGNPSDQVLVQPMTKEIAVSGVIMTHTLEDGAPYYVINYDDLSGRTDSVTGGVGVHKTVLVNHQCDRSHFDSNRLRAMIDLTKEIQSICGNLPLDIEFGLTKENKAYLFQVRPISLSRHWTEGVSAQINQTVSEICLIFKKISHPQKNIYGDRTILTTMTDWNPAEMIGVIPDPLAASLYRELITKDVWVKARTQMGYRDFSKELMVMIYGRPYIDVRCSFNSFLPEGLDPIVSQKLVNAWLDRLDQYPELHDKAEFDIAQTCHDFSFDDEFQERYSQILSENEFEYFKKLQKELTVKALTLSEDNTLVTSLAMIDRLIQKQQRRKNEADDVYSLIEECKNEGTKPFAIIARHAFIAEKFLRSAVRKDAIQDERVNEFKQSIHTITTEMTQDLQTVSKEKKNHAVFMEKYGHLRPGTYDIQSLCYRDRMNMLKSEINLPELPAKKKFVLTRSETEKINQLLSDTGISISAEDLLEHARLAIQGREYAKFVFTRNVSDILESLVTWGVKNDLSRRDLSLMKIEDLLKFWQEKDNDGLMESFRENKDDVIKNQILTRQIALSYLIRGERDIYIVPMHRSAPNFIGQKRIDSEVVCIAGHSSADVDIKDKVVCIENADPGYDWIFTKGIKALITKYGGTNSHMAIRCAEFGLPAAIGCGEEAYQRIVEAGRVELNCADKILRPHSLES